MDKLVGIRAWNWATAETKIKYCYKHINSNKMHNILQISYYCMYCSRTAVHRCVNIMFLLCRWYTIFISRYTEMPCFSHFTSLLSIFTYFNEIFLFVFFINNVRIRGKFNNNFYEETYRDKEFSSLYRTEGEDLFEMYALIGNINSENTSLNQVFGLVINVSCHMLSSQVFDILNGVDWMVERSYAITTHRECPHPHSTIPIIFQPFSVIIGMFIQIHCFRWLKFHDSVNIIYVQYKH